MDDVGFIHAEGPFPTWWIAAPFPVLVAWAGGSAAEALERRVRGADSGAEQLVRIASRQLGAMLDLDSDTLGDDRMGTVDGALASGRAAARALGGAPARS